MNKTSWLPCSGWLQFKLWTLLFHVRKSDMVSGSSIFVVHSLLCLCVCVRLGGVAALIPPKLLQLLLPAHLSSVSPHQLLFLSQILTLVVLTKLSISLGPCVNSMLCKVILICVFSRVSSVVNPRHLDSSSLFIHCVDHLASLVALCLYTFLTVLAFTVVNTLL